MRLVVWFINEVESKSRFVREKQLNYINNKWNECRRMNATRCNEEHVREREWKTKIKLKIIFVNLKFCVFHNWYSLTLLHWLFLFIWKTNLIALATKSASLCSVVLFLSFLQKHFYSHSTSTNSHSSSKSNGNGKIIIIMNMHNISIILLVVLNIFFLLSSLQLFCCLYSETALAVDWLVWIQIQLTKCVWSIQNLYYFILKLFYFV